MYTGILFSLFVQLFVDLLPLCHIVVDLKVGTHLRNTFEPAIIDQTNEKLR